MCGDPNSHGQLHCCAQSWLQKCPGNEHTHESEACLEILCGERAPHAAGAHRRHLQVRLHGKKVVHAVTKGRGRLDMPLCWPWLWHGNVKRTRSARVTICHLSVICTHHAAVGPQPVRQLLRGAAADKSLGSLVDRHQ